MLSKGKKIKGQGREGRDGVQRQGGRRSDFDAVLLDPLPSIDASVHEEHGHALFTS